jgi:hypothetical protein
MSKKNTKPKEQIPGGRCFLLDHKEIRWNILFLLSAYLKLRYFLPTAAFSAKLAYHLRREEILSKSISWMLLQSSLVREEQDGGEEGLKVGGGGSN